MLHLLFILMLNINPVTEYDLLFFAVTGAKESEGFATGKAVSEFITQIPFN